MATAGMSQILIVSHDGNTAAAMLSVLDTAGYDATATTNFEDARRVLDDDSPDLVIADERLGDFNGLHIIMTARAARPNVGAIVTTAVKNRGLEADAQSLNVHCIVTPKNPADWLGPISRMLPTARVA